MKTVIHSEYTVRAKLFAINHPIVYDIQNSRVSSKQILLTLSNAKVYTDINDMMIIIIGGNQRTKNQVSNSFKYLLFDMLSYKTLIFWWTAAYFFYSLLSKVNKENGTTRKKMNDKS